MREQGPAIDAVAERVGSGQQVTLLCSSACTDPERCHRTLLRGLVLERLEARSRTRTAPT
jgi:hypothetical protein